MRGCSNQKGFTIAELLIVVAIVAVLVGIALPVFTSQLESAKAATCLANRRSLLGEARVTALAGPESEETVFGRLYGEHDSSYTCPDNGVWTYQNGDILCSVAGHGPIGGGEHVDIDNPTPGGLSAMLNAVIDIFNGGAEPEDARSDSERIIQLQGNKVGDTDITDLLNEALGEDIFEPGYSNMLSAITEKKSADYNAEENPIQGLVYQAREDDNTYYLYYGSDVYAISSYGNLKNALKDEQYETAAEALDAFVKDPGNATKVP